MLIKLRNGKNDKYLCPIFSDFEKNYLISEIDMIIANGGEYIEFDNFKPNRILIYMGKYYVGECVGLLTTFLWEMFLTRIIVDGTDYESYLDFAREGGSHDLRTGQIILRYDLKKIKHRFFEEVFPDFTAEYKHRTDGKISRDFKKSIENKTAVYSEEHIANLKKIL